MRSAPKHNQCVTISQPGRRWARLLVVLALVAASSLGLQVPGAVPGASAALALHAGFFLVGLALLFRRTSGRNRIWLTVAAMAAVVGGASDWMPLPTVLRAAAVWLHVAGGLAAAYMLLRVPRVEGGALRRRWPGIALGVLLLLPLTGYVAAEARWIGWRPPRYDAGHAYEFLTAMTPEQSAESEFPSALRLRGGSGVTCGFSQCHARVGRELASGAHAEMGSSRAYAATFREFRRRRGGVAARWCEGCHAPERLSTTDAPSTGASDSHGGGVGCQVCHGVREVRALFGSAAVELDLRNTGRYSALDVWLRPKRHAMLNARPGLVRSSELCASCHRKNWGLAQNGYHWVPGPDEYGEWAGSRFSGAALYATPETKVARSCVDCHGAHVASPRPAVPPLALSLFLRRDTPAARTVEPAETAAPPAPGERVLLDVVVANDGIGHSFPTGMPDLQESWIEVRAWDRAARPIGTSGELRGTEIDPRAHFYRMVGLDRDGRRVLHGDADRMVTVAEWRRIPAGEADLARYTLRVPPGGLGRVSVRLRRRRRPDFARWVGESPPAPQTLAEWDHTIGSGRGQQEGRPARTWLGYGQALLRVHASSQAIQAVNRGLELAPADRALRLCLGRVYLDEGDLLAAQEQFQRVGGEEGQAWNASVLRQTGQFERAAALLEPLARRFPRDIRLRFELGQVYLAMLKNESAVREFRALLDVDPLSVSGHYNLMLCWQRLNQIADARKEEAIYSLLVADPAPPGPAVRSQPETRDGALVHVQLGGSQ